MSHPAPPIRTPAAPRRATLRRLAALVGGLVLGSLAQARTDLDLSGTWQFQKVNDLNYPPTGAWQDTTVPGYLHGYNYERAWFRKTFTLPSALPGDRLKARFGGAKFNAQIWLNGVHVGGSLNGYNPFEIDITQTALPGQVNELIVGVSDWTAYFSQPVDLANLKPGESPRDRPKNTLFAPIGGRFDLYGLWQPVVIRTVPEVFIADVFVLPSVRNRELKVRLRLRNESDSNRRVTVRLAVTDAASPPTLPATEVLLAPGTEQEVETGASWATAELWSPENPRLHHLQTSLEWSGQAIDQVSTRFGFRELWRNGADLILNGTPIHLLATATWPPDQPMDAASIRQVLLDVKAGNNKAFRLHTQPWDTTWYDLADEVGLLIVEEGAVWCDPAAYRLADPVFWSNYADHLRAAVRRDRNHPSIVLWSLENEILHCGGAKYYVNTEMELAQLAAVVRAEDPTRLLTYEADLDPGGTADVIGLHYPHEFPDFVTWPDTADWMGSPISVGAAPGVPWQWNRTKPLYIGEFLWVPGTSASAFTVFFGDDAYTDPVRYRNLSKGLTWRMQTEAYRRYGVSAMAPWTAFEDPAAQGGVIDLNPENNHLFQVQKAAYDPHAVFVHEYGTRFFTDAGAQRHVTVHNDTPLAGTFQLGWRTAGGPWNFRELPLNPAASTDVTLPFTAPSSAGPFNLEIELRQDQQVVHYQSLAYRAFNLDLFHPPARRLGLYDPAGTTAALLSREGVGFVPISAFHDLTRATCDILLIGAGALAPDPIPSVGPDTDAARWDAFLGQGGWILMLEQTTLPAWIPGELGLVAQPATLAFPFDQHPVVAGLTAEDLRWWNGRHAVADACFRAPTADFARIPVRIGSAAGLEHAGLVEIRRGTGGLLACQLRIVSALPSEPIARELLQRMLDYCAAPSPAPRPFGLLADSDSAVAQTLASNGALAENLVGRLADASLWRRFPLLVIGGRSVPWSEAQAHLEPLDAYVRQGGTLLLHRAPESFLAAARPLWLADLSPETNATFPVLRAPDVPPAWPVRNHDLYWIDDPGDWNRPAVLSTNIALRTWRRGFTLAQYATLRAADMSVKSTGAAVPNGWGLYANGYLAQTLQVPAPGQYQFGVLARGTPVNGVPPRLSLRIDGRVVDAVGVASPDWQLHPLHATLTAGTHELALVFDNDAHAPPEDRNLYLSETRWGLDTSPPSPRLLTRPGALVEIQRGAGRILLDEIAWETEARSRRQAHRLITSLLSSLGAASHRPPALLIEAESMKPVGVGASATNNGVVWLYTSGRLEAQVNVAGSTALEIEFMAQGTPAGGILPIVQLQVDGSVRASIQLTNTAPASYHTQFSLRSGTHTLALAFANDAWIPPEDRNLGLDWLRIQTPPTPRFVQIEPDSAASLTLTWESQPGRPISVAFRGALHGEAWQTATTLTPAGNAAHWTDDGTATGLPPFAPGAPTRFYRLEQD